MGESSRGDRCHSHLPHRRNYTLSEFWRIGDSLLIRALSLKMKRLALRGVTKKVHELIPCVPLLRERLVPCPEIAVAFIIFMRAFAPVTRCLPCEHLSSKVSKNLSIASSSLLRGQFTMRPKTIAISCYRMLSCVLPPVWSSKYRRLESLKSPYHYRTPPWFPLTHSWIVPALVTAWSQFTGLSRLAKFAAVRVRCLSSYEAQVRR